MRTTLNRFLNLALFICFCGLVSTGLMLFLKLPHGKGAGQYSVMGLTRHEWGGIHLWFAIAMILLVVAHLALHWQWLWKVASKRTQRRLVAGLAIGFLITALPLCWPTHGPSQEHTSTEHRGKHYGDQWDR